MASSPNVSPDDLLDEIQSEPELADADPEHIAARARLDQAELVEQVLTEVRLGLRQRGYAERQLFDDLWLYSWPVIKAFVRTMRMRQLLWRYDPSRWVPISPEDQVVLRNSEEERDGLALDVISRAVVDFRRNALLKRRWTPTGGASLRTYFIGTCALHFPRAYSAWSKTRSEQIDILARRHGIAMEDIGRQVSDLAADPAVQVANRDALRQMIDMAQPQTRLILGLIMQDRTHAEIADELGMTRRAIEGRLRSFRRRVDKRQTLLALGIGPLPTAPVNGGDR